MLVSVRRHIVARPIAHYTPIPEGCAHAFWGPWSLRTEAGLTDLTITFWIGLWAPKGTPKDVIARINAGLGRQEPIRPSGNDYATRALNLQYHRYRHPRPSARFTRLRSRNGGLSSSLPASRRSEADPLSIFHNLPLN